ncbi:sialin [Aphidius gifuensis]|uniref:sialin n=1 Tax=Aphidius gifuensis TaxID=684658 RepID=UPI001CDC774B|nr:sialin [Aphidius gifuensis]
MTREKGWMSCREVLWYLVFSGSAINYMLKINLNLVIVAMVVPRTNKLSSTAAQCTVDKPSLFSINNTISNVTFPSYQSTPSSMNISYEGRFDWTEYEQGLALGAFYWSYWSTHLPGGLLAQKYGTKIIFGGSNLLASLAGLMIPFAIKYHLYAFLLLRVIQGALMGGCVPSMHVLTAKWIPSNERSKFVSAYMGGSVGTAITYPFCAMIIHYFNWEAAFYLTSLLGIIWYCFWLYFVYDSPSQHPRISKIELDYILENTPKSLPNDEKRPVPWIAILTSGPVWVTIMAHWGAIWGFYTLLAQGPTYFSRIHGWNISTTGIISGAPHIFLMIFAYLFGTLSDWLQENKKMTRTGVRKLAMMVCTGVQAIFTIGLAFSGCHSVLAVFFMITGTITTGALSSGSLANFVDLSPNFGSVLLGICGLISNAAGALSPLIVGILTNGNQTVEQWRLVFLIAAANLIFGAVVYQTWGTAEEQTWNNNVKFDHEIGEEMLKLNDKPEKIMIINDNTCSCKEIKNYEKEKEANCK